MGTCRRTNDCSAGVDAVSPNTILLGCNRLSWGSPARIKWQHERVIGSGAVILAKSMFTEKGGASCETQRRDDVLEMAFDSVPKPADG